MREGHKQANKQPKTNYFKYEAYESEPKMHMRYNLSPELEDEVLDHGYFLKQRIRHRIHQLRKEYYRPSYLYHKPQIKKYKTRHHKPAHTY